MSNIRAFTMPKWDIEMTEGTVAEWMVKEGDSFSRGQTLCLIETAKITNEVEAEYDAVVKRLIIPAGGDAQAVGVLLAVFADAGASDAEIDAFVGSFKAADTSVAAKAGAAAPSPSPSPSPAAVPKKIETNRPISPQALKLAEDLGLDIAPIEGSGRGGRITYQDVVQASRPAAAPQIKGPLETPAPSYGVYASPLAIRIAALHGISLGGVMGTGPRGRISKADVLALLRQAAPAVASVAAPFVAGDNNANIVPMDRIRKIVAQRLTEAKTTIPHYRLNASVRVDALLALRKTANLVLDSKASINDYLVRAVGLALIRHPDINIQVHGDAIHQFPHADISIAVASPKGLVTPVIRSVDLMRVDQIALASRALIDKAEAGRLSYEDMSGGTFSISNLGMFGIDSFDAIINPPQGAILAVGGINRVLAEGKDGDVAFESRMNLSMSCDHRAIDGAAGARFLATLKALIEAPEGLFA